MIRLEHVSKSFGGVTAVSDLSFEVARGEIVTLLGPSGCGKSTTLRLIAGFEHPTGGRIIINDVDQTQVPPQRRGTGMVFQSYALFPHLSVFDNVAFGLKARGVSKREIPGRVEDALELVQLGGYGQRRIQQLSGGQQQRVALARALAPEPPVILLDEPLSNLDATLRERTRVELRTLLKRLDLTAVFVTHDQEEAFAISDRIILMDKGQLQQEGLPEELYLTPANRFVAGFVGRANFFDAVVESDNDGVVVCRVGNARWEGLPAGGTQPGDAVQLMLRPEQLELVATNAPRSESDLDVDIAERRFTGAHVVYVLRYGSEELLVMTANDRALDSVTPRVRPTTRGIVFPQTR